MNMHIFYEYIWKMVYQLGTVTRHLYLEVGIFTKQLLKRVAQVVTVITFFACRRRLVVLFAVTVAVSDHLQIGEVLL